MQFKLLFFFVYLAYIVFLLFFFDQLRLKFKSYSLHNWVSDLGNSKFKYSSRFNLSIGVFGVFSLFLVNELQYLLPNSVLTTLGLCFLTMVCIGDILVAIFPEDFEKMHVIVSGIAWCSALLSALFLIYPIYLSSTFPKAFLIINFSIVISDVLYLVTAISFMERFKWIFKKIKGLFEWSTLGLALAFDFFATVIVINNLLV